MNRYLKEAFLKISSIENKATNPELIGKLRNVPYRSPELHGKPIERSAKPIVKILRFTQYSPEVIVKANRFIYLSPQPITKILGPAKIM
ncbi:hypothetical protein G9A89_010103 [Geosiphon pyriformis]|nr:hypothetical protein G9A89_010103 [Geosiphon pyriformis]